jgi:hypothetical protein
MVLVELQRRLNAIEMVGNEGIDGAHAFDIVRSHPLEHALPWNGSIAGPAGQFQNDVLQ